ncbi:MAG: DUF2341 domain-containing protein, partial [Patescibacteria group bacterium]|nr:DUF2341 domain-containing protein [Patescibacteria group bacterium]
MSKARIMINKPIIKLGFLILFLILFFSYLHYNFSARASDERVSLFPQSFKAESNAADLNDPAIKSGSSWQGPEKALASEAGQAADFSSFDENNSAVFIFGTGKISTSTAGNETVNQPTAAGSAPENPADSASTPDVSLPEAPNPVLDNQASPVPPLDSSAPADNVDNPAAPAPVIQNHLPEAGPATAENAPVAPADNPVSAPADNSTPPPADNFVPPPPDNSAPAGNENNSAPVPVDVDQPANNDNAAGDPVSILDNLKTTVRAIGQFWENLVSAPKVLAENSAELNASSTALNNPSSPAGATELKDSLIFSDFNVESYTLASEITNVQLRLSLAAQSDFNFDHLLVEYSTGNDWQTAGDLFLKGGASNAANGGYFLYALPVFNSWDDLNNLRVRISYQNSELSADDLKTKATKIYLDGVWLEVDYNQGQVKGAQEKNQDLLAAGEEKHFFNDAPLYTGGQKTNFTYTDAIDNENLIIKTDRKDYTGLTNAPVYFSVTNIGAQAENFGVQTYFPADNGNVSGLEKLSRQAAVKEIPVKDSRIYYCAAGWQASSSEQIYFCPGKNMSRQCDSLSADQKKCQKDNAIVGSSTEISDVDQWDEAGITAGKLPDKRNFWQKLFGLGPRRKTVPDNFTPRASTAAGQFNIQPGETEYFKMNISFAPQSKGEFYLETVGDKSGYGLLDPWWNASWNYQVPITVTYSGSAVLTDFQTSVTIDTATLITAGKMKSDCSDIAFADSNKWSDTSELYYYLEPGTCNKSYTKVWVKIPSLSATKTIYLFYGNSAATSYSSGANTFVYFNDFESGVGFDAGTLNPVQKARVAKSGSYGLYANGATNYRLETRNGISSGRNLIWESWMRSESSSTASSLASITIGHPNGDTQNGYQAIIDPRVSNSRYLMIRSDYNSENILAFASTPAISTNTWYFMRFTWTSTNILWASLYAGATTTSPLLTCSTTDSTYTDGEYGVGSYQIGDWDNYRVRKYASSSVSTALGSETSITHVPANPSSLNQYSHATSTPLANGAWTNQNDIYLYATSTDKDSN